MAGRRDTIILGSLIGREPVTSAARIGSLLYSSGIPGVDQATGHLADSPKEQLDLAFRNARALLAEDGLSTDEIAQITIFISDRRYRQEVDRPWLEMFPGEDRPARKVTSAGLPDGQLVQLQVVAVAGGRREQLKVPGIVDRVPRPLGVRIGDFVFSSAVGPDIPGADRRPADAAGQIAQTFDNVQALVEAGRGTLDDVGLVWAYLGDFATYGTFGEVWLRAFPRDGDRPARKTVQYDFGGPTMLIEAQAVAVLGGERTNYEIEGTGHADPIPLGSRKGDYFFTSGISGNDPRTRQLVDGAGAQMRQAMANLRTLVDRMGGTFDNLVQVTTLLSDRSFATTVQTAWADIFPNPDDRPALQSVELGLPGRDTLVQVHAIGAF